MGKCGLKCVGEGYFRISGILIILVYVIILGINFYHYNSIAIFEYEHSNIQSEYVYLSNYTHAQNALYFLHKHNNINK